MTGFLSDDKRSRNRNSFGRCLRLFRKRMYMGKCNKTNFRVPSLTGTVHVYIWMSLYCSIQFSNKLHQNSYRGGHWGLQYCGISQFYMQYFSSKLTLVQFWKHTFHEVTFDSVHILSDIWHITVQTNRRTDGQMDRWMLNHFESIQPEFLFQMKQNG